MFQRFFRPFTWVPLALGAAWVLTPPAFAEEGSSRATRDRQPRVEQQAPPAQDASRLLQVRDRDAAPPRNARDQPPPRQAIQAPLAPIARQPVEAVVAAAAEADEPPAPPVEVGLENVAGDLLYTTYFYTAGEAIIHGYENNTEVKIISMEQRGVVWQGKVDAKKTVHVPTGSGVFSFVSDKKASILVGTPSSCAVVGFFIRDTDGLCRGKRLFSRMPSSSGHSSDCRIIVWAWEDIEVTIDDLTTDARVDRVKIAKGKFHQITGEKLANLNNHDLEFLADKDAMSVQVYYDEGFSVPADNGRGAGRLFHTYVGVITEGVNDLNLISYYTDAQVKVEDMATGEPIWKGKVGKGDIHSITLKGSHVRVTSDVDISVLVTPYEHYKAAYAEHHFGVGGEGTGIETLFLLTTPQELWLFSYYPNNSVRVFNGKTNELVWKGTLQNGQVQGVHPGHGYYRVESDKGISVMGGASACGGEFSPASGLFAVDEALFQVVRQIREERQAAARAQGVELDAKALNAPLNATELQRANQAVKDYTKRQAYSDNEVQDRLRAIQNKQQVENAPPPKTPDQAPAVKK